MEMFPENFKRKFTNRTKISKYETLRTNDMQIPRAQLDISIREIFISRRKSLNEIPKDIRNVESTHLLKQKLKTYLLDQ